MTVKTNSRITRHEGRVFKIVTENITLPSGMSADIDILQHPGAAAIVPIHGNMQVVLIKQYRHALRKHIWEIPAGTLDGRESALACAKRELKEETGFSADNWQKLASITPVPGYSDEQVHIYLASELTPARQDLDDDEILDVHPVAFDRALDMIYRGDIQDAKTITGLLLAQRLVGMK